MLFYSGECQILFAVFSLTLFTLIDNGWPCGLINSDLCLSFKPYMPTLISCFVIGAVPALVAATLQAISLTKKMERLLLPSRLCCWIAAVLYMTGIFYYSNYMTLNVWGQNLAGFTAGMLGAIALIQLLDIIYEKCQRSKHTWLKNYQIL